jgi:2'-5' RNA ligase
MTSRLQTALAGFGEFELVCERLGCFPDLRYPRVVWAWVHDAADRLQHLQAQIETAVGAFSEHCWCAASCPRQARSIPNWRGSA